MNPQEKPMTEPTGESRLMDTIDRLEAAIAECRAATRDAHAATKDLRSAVGSAEELEARVWAILREEPHSIIKAEMRSALDAALKQAVAEMSDARDTAVMQVTARIASLTEFLGEQGFAISPLVPTAGPDGKAPRINLGSIGSESLTITGRDGKTRRAVEL